MKSAGELASYQDNGRIDWDSRAESAGGSGGHGIDGNYLEYDQREVQDD